VAVPLHGHGGADAPGRGGVVGAVDIDVPIDVHDARAVRVVAKRLQRQGLEVRTLLGKHRRHLALGGAVNARVRPARLPVIEVGLRRFQRLEAQPLERHALGVAHGGFHLALAIGIADAARQRRDAVVRQHVAIQRIERRVVPLGASGPLLSKLSRTTTRGTPPCRRNASSCSSAQRRALERRVSRRTDFRLCPSVSTNSRQRRYFPVVGSRSIGPSP
jgi:hypothetical protein